MKKKDHIRICLLTTLAIVLILINTCKKDDKNPTNNKTEIIFNSKKNYSTITDIESNVYKTITIGTQTWMAENLRTCHFRNGLSIPEETNHIDWTNLSTCAFCNYNNTKNNDTIIKFGRLYNWYTVSGTNNIAPDGWHVPSEVEWSTLITYLGGVYIAGINMKEAGITHWLNLNPDTDNSSGLTLLPSGYRDNIEGEFVGIGTKGVWWSSTEFDSSNAWRQHVYNNQSFVFGTVINKSCGFSIRCIKN